MTFNIQQDITVTSQRNLWPYFTFGQTLIRDTNLVVHLHTVLKAHTSCAAGSTRVFDCPFVFVGELMG